MATPMIDQPLGGRDVKEWIGSSPNAKVPEYVRDRVFLRFGGRCVLTGIKLRAGEYNLDHGKALADGGEHRESNLRPVHRPAHREKTSAENAARDKADRMGRKHRGTWPASKTHLRSRKFQSTRDFA
ncbi:HNH endonuclease [Aureimonas altamirensis]|uniref:HNH endonuclease n=1 Tax=Aureimonas altamirensis TaxID=370622 RepID=UPI001E5A1A3A|nr:HNH endonuclease signature motif containing protein [Aureimonas altamirensis]UHD47643.1 HNH endonuclease [Aureimonas altamirensis]